MLELGNDEPTRAGARRRGGAAPAAAPNRDTPVPVARGVAGGAGVLHNLLFGLPAKAVVATSILLLGLLFGLQIEVFVATVILLVIVLADPQ